METYLDESSCKEDSSSDEASARQPGFRMGLDSSVLPATKEVGSGNRNGLQLEGYLITTGCASKDPRNCLKKKTKQIRTFNIGGKSYQMWGKLKPEGNDCSLTHDGHSFEWTQNRML